MKWASPPVDNLKISILLIFSVAALGCAHQNSRDSFPIEQQAHVYESYIRAQMAHFSGDLSGAINHARQALEEAPADADLTLFLGELLMLTDNSEEAVQVLEEGLSQHPQELKLHLALAEACRLNGEQEKVSSVLENAVLAFPHEAQAHLVLANHLAQEGQTGQGISLLQAFLTGHHDAVEVWVELSAFYQVEGQYDAAVTAIEVANRLLPNDEQILASLINNLGLAGRLLEGREVLDLCVTRFRQSVSCPVSFLAHLQAGNTPDPEKVAVTTDILRNLGRAVGANISRLRSVERILYRELGPLSAFLFTESLALDRPGNAQLQSMAAWSAYRNNQEDVAVSYMERGLEIRPNDADTLNFIGYSWAERGIRLDEAESMILRALQIRPSDGNIQDSLGWVYYQMGSFEEAIYWLESAAAISNNNAVILVHLGDAFRATGNIARAITSYEAALPHADAELLEEIQERLRDIQNENAS